VETVLGHGLASNKSGSLDPLKLRSAAANFVGRLVDLGLIRAAEFRVWRDRPRG
jgi:hypothetical protein